MTNLEAYANLADRIVELGYAMCARRAERDAMPGALVTMGPSVSITARLGKLGDAWDAVEAADPGGPVDRVARLATVQADQLLIALLVAPALDFRLAGMYRAAMPHADGELTVGGFVELCARDRIARDELLTRFAPQAPLRRFGMIRVSDSKTPLEDATVEVAPSVFAAFHGHAPTAPIDACCVERFDRAQSQAVIEHLGLWSLRERLNLVCGADLGAHRALAEMWSSASGRDAWHVSGRSACAPGVLLAASIANAVVVADVGDDGDLISELSAKAAASGHPVLGIGAAPDVRRQPGVARLELPGGIAPDTLSMAPTPETDPRLAEALQRMRALRREPLRDAG